MGNRAKVIAAAALAVILVGAGIWYWQRRQPEALEQGTGGEIFEKSQNPLKDELPETNPFKAESNPFEKSETNPFIGTYENPFE